MNVLLRGLIYPVAVAWKTSEEMSQSALYLSHIVRVRSCILNPNLVHIASDLIFISCFCGGSTECILAEVVVPGISSGAKWHARAFAQTKTCVQLANSNIAHLHCTTYVLRT